MSGGITISHSMYSFNRNNYGLKLLQNKHIFSREKNEKRSQLYVRPQSCSVLAVLSLH